MGCATIAIFATLMQPSGAPADRPPPWTSRAERVVVPIKVPAHGNAKEEKGTGFFVGFDDQTFYLATAGHVIWPKNIPGTYPPSNLPPSEKVKVELRLPGCTRLPAVAESEQASPLDELDLALVKVSLGELPSDVRADCRDVLAHLKELPRHIVDPEGNSLPGNTRVWVVSPGELVEGIQPRAITFKRYYKNELLFGESTFSPGESGSPVFSERGHLIGMAIKPKTATRFSMILTALDRDWQVPTNLAGPYSDLLFSDQYKDAPVSVAGGPDAPLRVPHPAPLGEVNLKLRINGSQEVSDVVNVRGSTMMCDVTLARWLAVHKRTWLYTSIGLIAATGIAFGLGKKWQNDFEQAPSSANYQKVRVVNGITIGFGGAALAALGATTAGYFSSDSTGIMCREGAR